MTNVAMKCFFKKGSHIKSGKCRLKNEEHFYNDDWKNNDRKLQNDSNNVTNMKTLIVEDITTFEGSYIWRETKIVVAMFCIICLFCLYKMPELREVIIYITKRFLYMLTYLQIIFLVLYSLCLFTITTLIII